MLILFSVLGQPPEKWICLDLWSNADFCLDLWSNADFCLDLWSNADFCLDLWSCADFCSELRFSVSAGEQRALTRENLLIMRKKSKNCSKLQESDHIGHNIEPSTDHLSTPILWMTKFQDIHYLILSPDKVATWRSSSMRYWASTPEGEISMKN